MLPCFPVVQCHRVSQAGEDGQNPESRALCPLSRSIGVQESATPDPFNPVSSPQNRQPVQNFLRSAQNPLLSSQNPPPLNPEIRTPLAQNPLHPNSDSLSSTQINQAHLPFCRRLIIDPHPDSPASQKIALNWMIWALGDAGVQSGQQNIEDWASPI